ncbi:MAG: S8 family serine peptidase [Limnospira sp.]
MTSPVNPSGILAQEYQGIGVPEESIDSILQRGGEELPIQKVPDRFTVRLSPTASPGQQPGQKPGGQFDPVVAVGDDLGNLPIHIKNTAYVPPGLSEVQVESTQLDEAMELARQSDRITFASHVYRVENDPGMVLYLTNQITIQFDESVEASTRDAIASTQGLRLLKPVDGIPNTFVYELGDRSAENPIKISNRLTWNPEVLTAEPNIIVKSQSYYRPSDPLYNRQWYLHNGGGNGIAADSHISVEGAWDITRGTRSVVVAITDDSVDINHIDFRGLGKIVAPLDLKGQDRLPLPEAPSDNHGTACAGVAVAEENGKGIVGVAPGCALMPIRTTGYLDDESVEKIFDWAIDRGASVISCSWGASAVYFPLSLRQRAVITKAATRGRNGRGCVIVFAAGNANRPINGTLNESGWPNNVIKGRTRWLAGFAVHPDVIAVSASTSLNKKSAYSNWGTGISVCAPSNNAPPGMWLQETGYIGTPPRITAPLQGLGIFTTDRVGAAGYDHEDFTPHFGGTSSATPVVAGVAALVLSVNPQLSAQEVRRIIEQTADKMTDPDPDPQLGIRMGTYDRNGYSQWFGYGRVNAEKAVKMAKSKQATRQQVSRRVERSNHQTLTIPDNHIEGVSSRISISDTSPILDIQVSVEIEHEFLGDVEIHLVEPGGKAVLLQNRTLGRSTSLKTTYTLQTTPYLRELLDLSPQGTWRLTAIDRAPEHTGKLKGWKLDLGL